MKNNDVADNFSDKESELNQNIDEILEQNQDETEQLEELEAADSESEIKALEEQIELLKDKNIRLMAEFDNYRKRSLKERGDLLKTASEGVLVDLLPLIDDFERAMQAMESTNDVEAVKEGVELIYDKFLKFLAQKGVKEIPTINEDFNPDLHEAITSFPAQDESMKGKIVDCVNKGYTMNDKVIRFPKVVVAN